MSLKCSWYGERQEVDELNDSQRVARATLNIDHDRNTIHYHSS